MDLCCKAASKSSHSLLAGALLSVLCLRLCSNDSILSFNSPPRQTKIFHGYFYTSPYPFKPWKILVCLGGLLKERIGSLGQSLRHKTHKKPLMKESVRSFQTYSVN